MFGRHHRKFPFFFLINNFPELPIFFITHSNNQKTILYSRKFSSAKNFVNSDRQAVRQEYVFVKRRSSLVCSSLIQLLLFCLSFIFAFMNISDPKLAVCEKFSQELNLVKNCCDESDEVKFLTKISCYRTMHLSFQSISIANTIVVITKRNMQNPKIAKPLC